MFSEKDLVQRFSAQRNRQQRLKQPEQQQPWEFVGYVYSVKDWRLRGFEKCPDFGVLLDYVYGAEKCPVRARIILTEYNHIV